MLSSGITKKKILEQRLAILNEQIVAANNQWITTLNQDEKITIQNRIDQLFVQMQKTEEELSLLESSAKNFNQQYLDFSANFHKIDFEEACFRFQNILSQFGKEGGAALFLIQEI